MNEYAFCRPFSQSINQPIDQSSHQSSTLEHIIKYSFLPISEIADAQHHRSHTTLLLLHFVFGSGVVRHVSEEPQPQHTTGYHFPYIRSLPGRVVDTNTGYFIDLFKVDVKLSSKDDSMHVSSHHVVMSTYVCACFRVVGCVLVDMVCVLTAGRLFVFLCAHA